VRYRIIKQNKNNFSIKLPLTMKNETLQPAVKKSQVEME